MKLVYAMGYTLTVVSLDKIKKVEIEIFRKTKKSIAKIKNI